MAKVFFFPNLMETINHKSKKLNEPQAQETWRQWRNTHIIIKLFKTRDKETLKSRERKNSYHTKGTKISMNSVSCQEKIQVINLWSNIFETLRGDIFSIWSKMKHFTHLKPERIHQQQKCTIRNIQGLLSERAKKIVEEENHIYTKEWIKPGIVNPCINLEYFLYYANLFKTITSI